MEKKTKYTNYLMIRKILFIALLLGQFIFAAIMSLIVYTNPQLMGEVDTETENILLIAVAVAFFSSVFMSFVLGKKLLALARMKTTLERKLASYQALLIIQLGVIELPSLIAIVCYGVTTNIIFLLLAALAILVFIIYRPTKSKLIRELQLSSDERDML